MKENYLRFVQWSQEDHLYIGYCPDLFVGGVCHGREEQKVYKELCGLVEEELLTRKRAKQPFPEMRTRAAQLVAV